MKIAFGYKMRSGKDTSANYLLNKYGGTKISFAKPIYDILEFTQTTCNFELKKDREFLRWVANWAKRKDPDIWINLALSQVQKDENYYCSDLRFLNELDCLKKQGWICVKVVRNEVEEKDLDQSEVELDKYTSWDYVIENNGTLEELYDKLDDLVRSINY
jgi:hypothetical protein